MPWPGAPTSAVSPLPSSATLEPTAALAPAPLPTSSAPSLQLSFERSHSHAAPTSPPPLPGPPTSAVAPSSDNATLSPC